MLRAITGGTRAGTSHATANDAAGTGLSWGVVPWALVCRVGDLRFQRVAMDRRRVVVVHGREDENQPANGTSCGGCELWVPR